MAQSTAPVLTRIVVVCLVCVAAAVSGDAALVLGGLGQDAHAQQSTLPAFASATLDENTRILTITFDNAIDVSETDLARMYVSDTNRADEVALDGATLDLAAVDSDSITITLTVSQMRHIAPMDSPQLDIGAGAVTDLSGSAISTAADRPIALTKERPGVIVKGSGSVQDTQGGNEMLWGASGVDIFTKDGKTYAAVASHLEDGLQIVDVTDPGNPTAAGSTEIGDAHDVEVFQKDGKTYAAVVGNHAIKLVDITDPGNPTAAGMVDDNGNRLLDQARDVKIFEIQSVLYAMVASEGEGGIQVINVDNPSAPFAAGMLADNGNRLLDQARDVDVFARGADTYAVVASQTDDGIQIVRISDPGGLVTTGRLAGDATLSYDDARAVAAFERDGRDYAAVASDKGIRIVDVTDPGRPTHSGQWLDGSFPSNRLPFDIDAFEMGGRTFVAMTFGGAGGLYIVDVTDPDNPTAAGNIVDWGNLLLEDARGVDIFKRGASTYAAVVSPEDDGIQMVRLALAEDAKPRLASVVLDERTRVLTITFDEAVDVSKTRLTQLYVSEIGTANGVSLDGAVFNRAAADSDSVSVTLAQSQLHRIAPMASPQLDIGEGAVTDLAGNGIAPAADNPITVTKQSQFVTLTAVGNLRDGGSLLLNGAWGVDTFKIGSRTYAAVASHTDNGLQIVDVTNPDSPTATGNVGQNVITPLGDARGVDVFTIGKKTYAAVVGEDDAIQLVDVSNPDSPTAAGKLRDDQDLFLGNPVDVAVFETGGKPYAVVPSPSDHGIQIVNVTDPDSPVATVNMGDDNNRRLNGAHGVAVFESDGMTYAVVTSHGEGGISKIRISPDNLHYSASVVTFSNSGYGDMRGVDTFKIGDRIYAAVASFGKDRLQIVDVTGQTAFGVGILRDDPTLLLDGAFDVDAFEMGGRTYAAVTSGHDGGLQIVDVTDPRSPTAAGIIADTGSLRLDDTRGVSVFETGGHTYAAVTSWEEDNLQIVRLAVADNEGPLFESASLNERTGAMKITFDGPIDVSETDLSRLHVSQAGAADSVSLDGADLDSSHDDTSSITVTLTESHLRRIIPMNTPQLDIGVGAVTGLAGNKIAAVPDNPVTISAEGGLLVLTPLGNVQDGGNRYLQGTFGVETYLVDDKVYAVAIGHNDHGLQIVDVTDPRSPTATGQKRDSSSGGIELRDPRGVGVFSNGQHFWAAVVGEDDAVQLMNLSNPFDPAYSGTLEDDTDLFLGNPYSAAAFKRDGNIYLAVPSPSDHGLQIVNVTDPDNPSAAGGLGDDGNRLLRGAAGVAVFETGGKTYAAVASSEEDGLQIVDVTDPDSPTAAGNLMDGSNQDRLLEEAWGVAVFETGDRIYAAVTAHEDDGLQIVDVTYPDSPQSVGRLKDTEGANEMLLDGPRGIDAFRIGAHSYVAVASAEGGLQIVDVTDPADPVHAGNVADSSSLLLSDTHDVDVFTGGTAYYAAVTSFPENGIQIVQLAHADTIRPDHVETVKPAFVFAALNENTGALTVTFDKTLDVSETDLARMYVSDVGGADEVALNGASFDPDANDSDTLSFTLAQPQLHGIAPMASPQLDIGAGAVTDLAENTIDVAANRPIALFQSQQSDTTPPSVLSAEFDRYTEILTVVLSETVDVSETDTSTINIWRGNAFIGVASSFDNTAPDSATVTFPVSQDAAESIELGLDIFFSPGSFKDTSGNAIDVLNRVEASVVDTTPPIGPELPNLVCEPPSSGHWHITQSCTLGSNTVAPAGITVHAPAFLAIPSDVTLDVNLENHGILIKDGAGLLIQNGGGVK